MPQVFGEGRLFQIKQRLVAIHGDRENPQSAVEREQEVQMVMLEYSYCLLYDLCAVGSVWFDFVFLQCP